MMNRIIKYIEYILFAILFFSAFWGINTFIYEKMTAFKVENFIFSLLFLLSMIFISILSVYKLTNKIVLSLFRYYWILVICSNLLDDIEWLDKLSEFIIYPFVNMFRLLFELTDGETATAIGILCAYYILPVSMIIYFSIMILIWRNKKKKIEKEQ